ncbi:hypothetical protein [Rhodococcus erythropolis]|uniref:Uncharacterized protein n=1 Tax=Rhodococcus erythropolis TaxID=1833 RepID=A0AAX4A017_RHOER|nr:hypothetical protein [Rhodococcus erythropolis]WMN01937.1 hypothetical protein QIE55_32095 [Rhodococcus erythropolis]
MFLVATGIQFAVARAQIRTIFIGGATSTALSMLALYGAVQSDAAALSDHANQVRSGVSINRSFRLEQQ